MKGIDFVAETASFLLTINDSGSEIENYMEFVTSVFAIMTCL